MELTPKALPDPLFDLEQAITRLEDVFGLYVAPELERLRDVDPDDPDAARTLEWTAELTWAITHVTAGGKFVFGTEVGSWLNGELRQHLRAAAERAERIGRVEGAAEERARQADLELTATHRDIRLAVAQVRRGDDRREAWERALW